MRCFTFICRWSDVFNLYFSPWYFPFYFQMNLYVYFYMRMKWWFWFLCLTDHRSVETAGIPRAARVREFQTTPKRSCGRRPGNPTNAVPHAAIHRHRARWLPGNNTYTVGSRPGFHHLPRFDQGLTFYYCICYFCTFTSKYLSLICSTPVLFMFKIIITYGEWGRMVRKWNKGKYFFVCSTGIWV